MHELLRQYGEEKLQAAPQEAEKAQDLHCTYYAGFLHRKEEDLTGRRQKAALEEIGAEIDNVRVAWHWAVERGEVEAIEKSVRSLHRFYEMRSRFQEGEAAFGRGVEALKAPGGMVEHPSKKTGLVLGMVLGRYGIFCGWHPRHGKLDPGKARELLQESLAILRPLEARAEVALILNHLGDVARAMGTPAESKQRYQESIALYRAVGDGWGLALALNGLGNTSFDLGEYSPARQHYQESLALFKAAGDRWGVSRTLNNLGNVPFQLGEYEQAGALYRESLAIAGEIGNRRGMAICLNNLGEVAYRLEEYAEATQCLQECLTISKEIGHPQVIGNALNFLGHIAYRRGEYPEARRIYRESLAISRESGLPRMTALSLNSLGRTARVLGEYQESMRCFREALKAAMGVHAFPVALDVLVGVATLLPEAGEKERGLELLAFVLHHPAANKETQVRAERLLGELTPRPPSQVVAAALERGKARKFEEVVEEMLKGKSSAIDPQGIACYNFLKARANGLPALHQEGEDWPWPSP